MRGVGLATIRVVAQLHAGGVSGANEILVAPLHAHPRDAVALAQDALSQRLVVRRHRRAGFGGGKAVLCGRRGWLGERLARVASAHAVRLERCHFALFMCCAHM